MSAAVIAETPVGFRTWASPGACHTSTNAVSAPHRAAYARDFMNPSSVSTVIRQVERARLREKRHGSHEDLAPRTARTSRGNSSRGARGHHGGSDATDCTDA